MSKNSVLRWYWIVPTDPRTGRDHAGTGDYFASLEDAIEAANYYRRRRVRKYSGHRRVLPTKVLNVHHEVVATLGRGKSVRITERAS